MMSVSHWALGSNEVGAEARPDWLLGALDDDVMPAVVDLVAVGSSFALVTIVARDGGPRPVGSQMLVTTERFWGFVSGGCVEADVALQGCAAMTDGRSRRLAYGRGSPFIDIRLPCGGRIDLLVEPIAPGDPAIATLVSAWLHRRAARYLSDGVVRRCVEPGAQEEGAWIANRIQVPMQRLAVFGHDPYALAIASAGLHQGWDVTLVRPGGPTTRPPLDVRYRTDAPDSALAALIPDAWTAVVVATHDGDLDHAGLTAALRSEAGYVGVLGSHRRLDQRRVRLTAAGMSEADLLRLHAPIGLPISASSPRDIAVSVVAEIIASRAAP